MFRLQNHGTRLDQTHVSHSGYISCPQYSSRFNHPLYRKSYKVSHSKAFSSFRYHPSWVQIFSLESCFHLNTYVILKLMRAYIIVKPSQYLDNCVSGYYVNQHSVSIKQDLQSAPCSSNNAFLLSVIQFIKQQFYHHFFYMVC